MDANMQLYKIELEVDNGIFHDHDFAIVVANNEEEANKKLRQYINSINSETCVSKIYKTEIFNGEVFTGNHGWK